MIIKGINVNYHSNKKLWYIVLMAITIAMILITITIVGLAKAPKNQPLQKAEIFDITQYETEYEINIKSNKNSNRYIMKEWYLEKENESYFKFETQNENTTNLCYIIAHQQLLLKANGQKNEYSLSEYIVNKENILSLSTFLQLYRLIEKHDKTDGFKIQIQEIDDKICYQLVFEYEKIKQLDETNEIVAEYNTIVQDNNRVSKMELMVSQTNNMPIEYIIYDQNGIAMIDISYHYFHINHNFDEKLFAF